MEKNKTSFSREDTVTCCYAGNHAPFLVQSHNTDWPRSFSLFNGAFTIPGRNILSILDAQLTFTPQESHYTGLLGCLFGCLPVLVSNGDISSVHQEFPDAGTMPRAGRKV